jgi:hypothetical protein
MYLMAGVHSSEDISVEASAGDSVAATAVDVLAEDKRTEEDETGATDDEIAAEDRATDDTGSPLGATDCTADEAGATTAEDAGIVADDTATDG